MNAELENDVGNGHDGDWFVLEEQAKVDDELRGPLVCEMGTSLLSTKDRVPWKALVLKQGRLRLALRMIFGSAKGSHTEMECPGNLFLSLLTLKRHFVAVFQIVYSQKAELWMNDFWKSLDS